MNKPVGELHLFADAILTERIQDRSGIYQSPEPERMFVLNDLIESEPDRGWDLIKILLDKAGSDDDLLAYIGAGPLQHLVAYHAHRFIDELETHARADQRFRFALECMTVDSAWVSPVVLTRLKRMAPDVRIWRSGLSS